MIEQFMEKVAKRRVGKEILKDHKAGMRFVELWNKYEDYPISDVWRELAGDSFMRMRNKFPQSARNSGNKDISRDRVFESILNGNGKKPNEFNPEQYTTKKGPKLGETWYARWNDIYNRRALKGDYGEPYKISPERAARQARIKELTGKYGE